MKSPGGGKALLFEQPIVDGKKSEFPVAINTMGSRRRIALALQVADIGDVAQEIQLILKAKPPTDLREGWSLLKQGRGLPGGVARNRRTPNTQHPTPNAH
jgi:4-hydroxy-3-polyprenylbenzoate decarboxylase